MMYIQDYEGYYPMSVHPDWLNGTPRVVAYFDALMPYVTNRQVWSCPSEPEAMDWETMVSGSGGTSQTGCWAGKLGASTGNLRYFSYNGNYSLIRPGNNNAFFGGASYPVVNTAVLPRPSGTAMLADGLLLCDFSHPIAGTQKPARHGNGINCTYADGHAGFMKVRRDAAGRWVVDGGPYNGANELHGIVMDNGSLVIQWGQE